MVVTAPALDVAFICCIPPARASPETPTLCAGGACLEQEGANRLFVMPFKAALGLRVRNLGASAMGGFGGGDAWGCCMSE